MQSSAAPASRHLPIRKDWLAATQEPALEPERPIIDPHHHLWDRPGNRYLFHDLMEDLNSGHNIRATVFLECREMYRAEGPPEQRSLGETQFVAGVSAMSESGKYGATRACAGIIGNVDFRVGSRARGILEQHITLSGGRFRGIRNGATWHADPNLRIFTSGSGEGLYLDRAWREGFAALAPLNLTFEAWMFHSQLGDLVDLARAFPETNIAAFGPDRSMFESNFPVDKGMCSYSNLWNAFKRVAENYSNDEKNAMFHNTALKFYRLY